MSSWPGPETWPLRKVEESYDSDIYWHELCNWSSANFPGTGISSSAWHNTLLVQLYTIRKIGAYYLHRYLGRYLGIQSARYITVSTAQWIGTDRGGPRFPRFSWRPRYVYMYIYSKVVYEGISPSREPIFYMMYVQEFPKCLDPRGPESWQKETI